MDGMSVINQMLLDLDRRRASGEERNRIPDHVRALPGSAAAGKPMLPYVIAMAIAVFSLAAGGLWWWQDALPGKPPSVAIIPGAPLEPETAERIARRMSLELAQLPATAEPPLDVTTPSGISVQSVIVNEPPPWASPRGEPPATPTAPPEDVPPPRSPKPAAVAATPALAKPGATTFAAPASSVTIDKRAREQTPQQRAEAEYARGANALQQGRAVEARSAFEAALQIVPGHHGARQALAGVLLDARQQDEAMRVLQEGLQITPAQFGFAMMLARLQVERGELDAGVQTLSRSAEYAGNSADYAAFYAGLLQRQQRHAEAVEFFDRALRLRANVGIWLLGMGMSLDVLGRAAEAQDAFRRAKASGNLPADLQAYADQRLR
jgi:MSHA biogenesis protein MshN